MEKKKDRECLNQIREHFPPMPSYIIILTTIIVIINVHVKSNKRLSASTYTHTNICTYIQLQSNVRNLWCESDDILNVDFGHWNPEWYAKERQNADQLLCVVSSRAVCAFDFCVYDRYIWTTTTLKKKGHTK